MLGANDIRFDNAFDVWPLALFSSHLPSVMNVISIVLVSKMVPGLLCGGISTAMITAKQLKKNAVEVPKTTKTSIVGDPCFMLLYAEM